jgi:hypothetical protein
MLIICYGITKSGSTLAFELIKGMLESVGHGQVRLPDGAINPGHRINYVQPLDRNRLSQLLEAVGDRWIAVKTHAGFPDVMLPQLERLQNQQRIQIVASYRDPRDICLSLIDAGHRSRAEGKKEFSEVNDLETAIPRVSEQIVKFNKWAAIKGTLRLDYDLVAFSPDAAIDRIEQSLGFVCDRARAKEHAFEQAFTQMNKGQRSRAREEMSEEQYAELTRTFSSFISNVCEGDGEAWLGGLRERIRARLKSRRPGASDADASEVRARGAGAHRRKARASETSN